MITIGFLLLITSIKAQQNLVSNPGFDEVYNSCPTTAVGLSNVKYWYEPSLGSPDDFYYCFNQFMISKGIPKNTNGNQFPITDSIYVGIIAGGNGQAREYIAIHLNSKLKKDYTYCGEFYTSLCDGCEFAISSLGMYFSVDSVFDSTYTSLKYIPQIQNDSLNIITDTVNWVKVSGSFVAQGGEKYLIIGNFNDSASTMKHSKQVRTYPPNCAPCYGKDFAYYYIDNVSVYACDSPLVEEPQDTTFIFIPNVFSPNQDGENDLWEVTTNKVNSLNIQVFNRWGEQVYKANLINSEEPTNFNPAWDGYTPTGKPVPEGTYFYIIQYTLPSGETKVEKGHLTLIR